MSHLSIDSIMSANTYNRLIIDHEATDRAALLDLKRKYLPELMKILVTHGVADFVELHLLHRHFQLDEGEAVVHRTLEIPGAGHVPSVCVDIAKVIDCGEPIRSFLVPILWMTSSSDDLIAYEYGLDASFGSHKRGVKSIPTEQWIAFAREFSAHVRTADIADLVSFKDKQCINGGEYVVPDMRVLFRVPIGSINLQPGSGLLDSGWGPDATTGPDISFPKSTDKHVTKTRQTTGGTVAVVHITTKKGENAFNPKEVPLLYTDAMWASVESEDFWAVSSQ